MYAICSVKKDDVKNCVEAMNTSGNRGDLIQTSGKKYTTMEAHRAQVGPMHKKVEEEFDYIIDMKSMTIHSDAECDNCGNDRIKARLINLKTTGLNICTCAK